LINSDSEKNTNNTNNENNYSYEIQRSFSDESFNFNNQKEEENIKHNFRRISSDPKSNFNLNPNKEKEEDFSFEEFEKNLEYNDSNIGEENFLNFYKKKEMEKLDMQIKQIISDIIEINTDCLNSIINEIFSTKRGDFLKTSWRENNKKLLSFEINKNYTSLIDKIYLFMPKSRSENSFHPQSKSTRNTFSFSKNNNEIEFNNLNSEMDLDVKEDKEDYNKKKIKEEIIEFKKIENKIIKNFFDLSETQISGDAIRDWLYENSKY